ncbi:MAG: CHASE3 domain-containing protein [Minicystis sp.]
MRAARRWHLGWPTTAAFGAAVALFLAAGLGGLREQDATYEMGNEAIHTLEVLDRTNLILIHLVDAETGQRGYLITGATSYLDPYHAALKLLPTDLDRLRALTEANPAQQERLARLAALMKDKLDELAHTIELQQHSGREAALGVVATDTGRVTMNGIRKVLGEIDNDERAVVAQRTAARARRSGRTSALTSLAVLLGAALAGASILGLNRQSGRRVAAERDATANRERLRVTLHSIGDAVLATDRDGAVVFMNPIAEALTGWTLAEAAGQPIDRVFRVVHEDTHAPVDSPVTRALREGVVVGLANHSALVTKDGREVPIDDSAAPIRGADGELLGVVLVFRDITERKRAELESARLARAEIEQAEAEAANRSKDEFLAVLSHELRSPLHAMLGWMSILKKGLSTGRSVDRAVETIERNIHLQTQIVNNLLDVSRIISGKLELEEEPLDLAVVVHATVESARPSAEAKGIALVTQVGPLSGGVVGDAKRLGQVVGNLVTNAVKFTPRGGRVAVTLADDGGEARVEVVDTGIGITPEFLPHVFNRFRQADGTSTRRHGGLGLGLSIVKTLVELHEGRVEARSEGDGKGARFIVRLPLRAATVAPPPPAAEPADHSAELEGMTVVLVEDDADGREALRLALEQSGAAVHACASVPEARDVLTRVHPDILVSDVGMPGENGYDLVKLVRARAGSYLPSIAITGFVSAQDRAEALRSGFDEHVAKPVNADALIAKMRRVVRRSRTSRPSLT